MADVERSKYHTIFLKLKKDTELGFNLGNYFKQNNETT